jgi:D-alanyl-lipoteichoic acid acyltransferase DltB (MBOAT superfamily)
MLFNSYEFIFIFLPLAFGVYFFLNAKVSALSAKIWIIFASLFFYSWWNINYLPLIILSILVNFFISQALMKEPKAKKFYLLTGLAFNIGLLGYFKYMDFFISNWNWGFSADIPLLHLALPLAISFYTLQQIAYLVDSYGGLVKEKNFLNYTLFVTFFPQLIAGPIVHHKEMMPQFASEKNNSLNYNNIAAGFFIFSLGLFKKIIIADTFAQWTNAGYAHADVLNMLEAWVTSLSYTFQLYFDFSGYTDMAIGAALLFNIKLPQNFNSPYKATGFIDFWQRWHMTLTRFITTYIYKPFLKSLGKVSFEKAMFASIFTMLIAGIWHGAAWTFVLFGLLHGLGITINHYWKKSKIKMPTWLAWFITFNFLNLSFVIFRAPNMQTATEVFSAMFGGNGLVLSEKYFSFLSSFEGSFFKFSAVFPHIEGSSITTVAIILALMTVLAFKNSTAFLKEFQSTRLSLAFGLFLFILATSFMSRISEFLYFNF